MKIKTITIICYILAWALGASGTDVCAADGKFQHYYATADVILERIAGLSEKYPHFSEVEADAEVTQGTEGLSVYFSYEHGIDNKPNPGYVEGKKMSRTVQNYSKSEGISLNIYFYTGRWSGAAMVRPEKIGKMNIVVFLEGAETKALDEIRKDIYDILDEEKTNHYRRQKNNQKKKNRRTGK